MLEIGRVTHYYGKISVAVVTLREPLALKERVAFQGFTTDFEQEIDSIQVDHKEMERAEKGQEIAIKVREKVRVGDSLYRLEP